MLKKRIIPCLDIKNGRTVKGVNFVDLIDAGNPIELARKYEKENADEIVFLDITATLENRNTFIDLVKEIAATISIPFTVGGGIKTIEDVSKLIYAGADKVSINSAAIANPTFITSIAKEFGNQCVVIAIDTKFIDDEWMVFTNAGTKSTELKTLDWAKQCEQLGAGEILLTSMNNDGTKAGYAIDITKLVSESLNIPVIASGGAGLMNHFVDVFKKTSVTGALAANIFHFGEMSIQDLKKYLLKNNITIRYENEF